MKNILFTLLTFFAIQNLQAQSKLLIGLEGGVNHTLVREKENGMASPAKTPQFSSLFGVNFQYNFGKVLGLKTGLGYESKRYYEYVTLGDNIADGTDNKFHYKLSYLTIPVQLTAKIGNDKFNVFGAAGAYVSILTGAQTKISNTKKDYTSNINSLDYGLSFSIGAVKSITSKLGLSLEIRDNLGLSDITKYHITDTRLNSVYLLAGLKYSIK